MAAPAPLNSFFGGLSMSIPIHVLTLLNGSVFGIAGFVHRASRGSTEAMAAIAGLICGGIIIGSIESEWSGPSGPSVSNLVASGFLAGLGTKLSNGCTSGHMVCGIARFSMRSILATAIFFITGAVMAHTLYGNLDPIASLDWSLGINERKLIVAQIVPFAVSGLLYLFAPFRQSDRPNFNTNKEGSVELEPQSALRHLASLTTSIHFAFALQLSGLTDPSRVIRFLLLPFHRAFDPSLGILAAGTMPLTILLYHYARGNEIPRLGGRWSIPKEDRVGWKLIIGSAIFGISWGMAGVCPGPGLVNFGHALVNNNARLPPTTLWLLAVVAGGLIV